MSSLIHVLAVWRKYQSTEKFAVEGVGVSITVTPCWCYGSETMDMNPDIPKAVWGFNGTERPGAVYLAAVLGAHNQKGIPAFGIYGKDVQDLSDTSIPKMCRKNYFNLQSPPCRCYFKRKIVSVDGVCIYGDCR